VAVVIPETRASYLPELGALVWPEATVEIGRGQGHPADTFVVVPSVKSPRLLVPAQGGKIASASVKYATDRGHGRQRLRREVVAATFRLGLGGVLFRDRVVISRAERDDSLDRHLSAVLGRPVAVSLPIGPARANRKPILQLVGADGRLIGYAKVGVNELTRQLVDAEARALTEIAGTDLGPIHTATVLHYGDWREHRVLVQGALPVWLPRADPAAAQRAITQAVVVLDRAFGVRELGYAASPFAAGLGRQIENEAGHPNYEQLAGVHQQLRELDPVLPFGAWHGDWHDGNRVALADGRVLLWDWERFARDVPLGWDAVHAFLQHAIHQEWADPAVAAERTLAQAPAILAPFDLATEVARIVAALYLLEIAVRYTRDRQAEAGARTGRVDIWLLPPLARHIQQIVRK
jgi:hypothetical protein